MITTSLKIRCCEKATKFEKISHFFWQWKFRFSKKATKIDVCVAFLENLNFT